MLRRSNVGRPNGFRSKDVEKNFLTRKFRKRFSTKTKVKIEPRLNLENKVRESLMKEMDTAHLLVLTSSNKLFFNSETTY